MALSAPAGTLSAALAHSPAGRLERHPGWQAGCFAGGRRRARLMKRLKQFTIERRRAWRIRARSTQLDEPKWIRHCSFGWKQRLLGSESRARLLFASPPARPRDRSSASTRRRARDGRGQVFRHVWSFIIKLRSQQVGRVGHWVAELRLDRDIRRNRQLVGITG